MRPHPSSLFHLSLPPLTLASDSLLRLQLRSCSTAVPRSCSRRCFLRLVCPSVCCVLYGAVLDTIQRNHSSTIPSSTLRSQQLSPAHCLLTWLKPSVHQHPQLHLLLHHHLLSPPDTDETPFPVCGDIIRGALLSHRWPSLSPTLSSHSSTAFNCHHQIQ